MFSHHLENKTEPCPVETVCNSSAEERINKLCTILQSQLEILVPLVETCKNLYGDTYNIPDTPTFPEIKTFLKENGYAKTFNLIFIHIETITSLNKEISNTLNGEFRFV